MFQRLGKRSTQSLHTYTVCRSCGETCSRLTAHGEKLSGEREGDKGEEEGRWATGISFYGNQHLAHGNKLPALLKQRERNGWGRSSSGFNA